MAEIRALTHADIPLVVSLLRAHMDGWSLDERAVVGLMLDHPWAEEELRSLVALEGDEIVGFTGVQARRMRVDGRTILGVCCTNAVVSPTYRGGAVGAFLLSRILGGPQAVTWADGATEAVARVYGIHGGNVDHTRACDWMLVLRPVRWLQAIATEAARRGVSRRIIGPVSAVPVQVAGRRLLPHAFPASPPDVVGEDTTAARIAEHVPALNAQRRVWVDHDAEHLDHLFRLVELYHRPLVRRLVLRRGRAIGWYAYVLRRGGTSRVLHVAALERETEHVLGELIDHARAEGSAVVSGRAEPHLRRALDRRVAVLGYARQPVIRAKDPELAAALATGASLLTRLEGEVFAI